MTSSLTSRCYTLPDLTGSATGQGQNPVQNGLQCQSRSSALVTCKPSDGRRINSNLPTILSQHGGSNSRISRPINSAIGAGVGGTCRVQNSVRPKSFIATSSYNDLKDTGNELFARLRERRLLLEKLEESSQSRKKSANTSSRIPTTGVSAQIPNNNNNNNNDNNVSSKNGRGKKLGSNRYSSNISASVGDVSSSKNINNSSNNNCSITGNGATDNDGNPWIPITDENVRSNKKATVISLKRPYQFSESGSDSKTTSRDRTARDQTSGESGSRPRDSGSRDLTSRDSGSWSHTSGSRSRDIESRDHTSRDPLVTPRVLSVIPTGSRSSTGLLQIPAEQQERLRQQARHLSRGFDAMAVLVQYLTNREDLSFQSLCKQLAHRKSQLNQQKRQITELSERNHALSTDLTTARQLVDDINSRNEELTKEGRRLKTEVKELGRFRNSFVSDFGKLDSRLKDLTQKNDELTTENENLTDRLSEFQSKYGDVIQRLSDVTKERDKALEDRRDAIKQRDDFIRQHDDVKKELRVARAERDKMKEERDLVKGDKDDIISRTDDVIRERDDVIKQRNEALQRQSELVQQITNIRLEHNDNIRTKAQLEQDLLKTASEKERHLLERQQQELLLSELRQELKNIERQLLEAKQKLSSARAEFSEKLQAERVELQSRLQAEQAGFKQQLQAEKARFKQQLQDEREELNKQLLAKKAEFDFKQTAANKDELKLAELKTEYQNQISELHIYHQVEINKIKSAYKAEREILQKEMRSLENSHKMELSRVRDEYSATIKELKEERRIADQEHRKALERLKTESERMMEEKKLEYNVEIKNATNTRQIAPAVVSGSSVDSGMSESGRETRVTRSSGQGVSGEYLEQEVESLRTVLDMRNEELQRIRRSAAEMSKRLEEIPVLIDTVEKQRQKIENLDAVISLKADYERQLSEKHQGLLRKVDRDSKAIKRLSMDKEELVWKLNQSEVCLKSGSRQSLEHLSPDPESAGSTPDVFGNAASMDCLQTAEDQMLGRPSGFRGFQTKQQRPKSMVVLGSKTSSSSRHSESSRMSSGTGKGSSNVDQGSTGSVVGVSTRSGGSISNRKVSRPSSASISSSNLPGMERLVEQRHIEDIAEIRQTDV